MNENHTSVSRPIAKQMLNNVYAKINADIATPDYEERKWLDALAYDCECSLQPHIGVNKTQLFVITNFLNNIPLSADPADDMSISFFLYQTREIA